MSLRFAVKRIGWLMLYAVSRRILHRSGPQLLVELPHHITRHAQTPDTFLDRITRDLTNICSGVAHSLADVLDMMSEISGYRIEVRVNPAFVRGNEVARLVGSNARLVACCGAGISIDLATTLRWMYPAQPDPLVL